MTVARPLRAGLLVSALCALTSPLSAQSDLDTYLAERRAMAMSEAAENDLRMVAGLLTGSEVLALEHDPDGSYSRYYSNAACLHPGADTPERLKLVQDLKSRAEAAFSRLKSLADFDHSGFVTTEEGKRFRTAVEFGLSVDQLATDDLTSVERIAKALTMQPDSLRSAALDYIAIRAAADPLTAAALPELPSSLLGRSSNPSLQRTLPG